MGTTTEGTPVDRTLPVQMRQLIELAATSPTLEGTDLLHESLGADVFAPIGWLLHLDRRAAHLGQKRLMVMADPGRAPRALLITERGDTRYLDLAEITAWITEPVAGADPDTTEPALSAEQLADYMRAVDAGWQTSRRTTLTRVPTTPEITHAASRCDFTASNWHYNNPASEHHRSTGAQVSLTLCLGSLSAQSNWRWALDDTSRQVDPADILRRISQSPLWAEPVAVFDEDLDTWTY